MSFKKLRNSYSRVEDLEDIPIQLQDMGAPGELYKKYQAIVRNKIKLVGGPPLGSTTLAFDLSRSSPVIAVNSWFMHACSGIESK